MSEQRPAEGNRGGKEGETGPPATTVLLERARGDDAAALGEILRRLQPLIENQVRRDRGPQLKARYDTVDLRQDVMIELLGYLPRVKIRDSRALEAYLAAVVRNTLRDTHAKVTALRRSLNRERPLPSDSILELDPPREATQSPSDLAARHEQEAWLRLALPLLPPEDEELFLRAKVRFEPYTELAKEYGATADALRMRVARIMSRLLRLIVALKDGRISDVLHGEADTRPLS